MNKAGIGTTGLGVPGLHGPVRLRLAAAILLASASFAGAVKTTDAPVAEAAGSAAAADPPGALNEPPKIFARITSVAKGLNTPDGLVCDDETGILYVAEEEPATISRVLPDGTKQVFADATTPLYEEKGDARRKTQGLRSPEGLALDGEGKLYVVEDVPGGRLVVFNLPDAKTGQRAGSGKVVPLPIEENRIAWESVAVGPAGELLLAGSTMESVLGEMQREGVFGLYFRGVVLYRDEQGVWWMVLNHTMASYSATCFSPDGDYAFFASEVPGDVGCLDLRSRKVRTCFANKTFQSPEGLASLPDGSVLVAEEGGKIYRYDPMLNTTQLMYDHSGSIETVRWDGTRRRLLLTDDHHGAVVALELKAGLDFRSSFGMFPGMIRDIPFEDQTTPVEMIPERCPDYLAEVLKLGGYDPRKKDVDIAFHDFARKYCLVAIDADAELFPPDETVEDPLTRIQFVIVAPYLVGVKEGELIWSSSGFTAVKKSGQVVKTELAQRQIVQGDLMESRFLPIGGQKIALPMPFSARINTDGIASINFMGMGVTPNFFLVLNTVDPNQSVMVVMQPDRRPQQYKITLPPKRDVRHWVIALERKEPEVWKRLRFRP